MQTFSTNQMNRIGLNSIRIRFPSFRNFFVLTILHSTFYIHRYKHIKQLQNKNNIIFTQNYTICKYTIYLLPNCFSPELDPTYLSSLTRFSLSICQWKINSILYSDYNIFSFTLPLNEYMVISIWYDHNVI